MCNISHDSIPFPSCVCCAVMSRSSDDVTWCLPPPTLFPPFVSTPLPKTLKRAQRVARGQHLGRRKRRRAPLTGRPRNQTAYHLNPVSVCPATKHPHPCKWRTQLCSASHRQQSDHRPRQPTTFPRFFPLKLASYPGPTGTGAEPALVQYTLNKPPCRYSYRTHLRPGLTKCQGQGQR